MLAASPIGVPLLGGPGAAEEFAGPAQRQFLVGRSGAGAGGFAPGTPVALVSMAAGDDTGQRTDDLAAPILRALAASPAARELLAPTGVLDGAPVVVASGRPGTTDLPDQRLVELRPGAPAPVVGVSLAHIVGTATGAGDDHAGPPTLELDPSPPDGGPEPATTPTTTTPTAGPTTGPEPATTSTTSTTSTTTTTTTTTAPAPGAASGSNAGSNAGSSADPGDGTVRFDVTDSTVVTRPGPPAPTTSTAPPAPTTTTADPAAPVVGGSGLGSSFGFAEYYKAYFVTSEFDRDVPLIAAAGARWVRMDCDWSSTEPARGVYNWSRLDHAVAVASQYGLKTLCVLDFGTAWDGSCVSGTCKRLPVHPDWFGEFAAAVTARYSRSVMPALEVWNEPNLLGFASPLERGGNYAGLLRAVYPAVKAVDPNMTVLAGALAQQGGDTAVGVTPSTFLSTMYGAGAKGFFDAVSLHPYGQPGLSYALSQLDAMHSIMSANGDGAKKVWSTEAGESTCEVSEATQAQTYQDYVNVWRSGTRPWLGPVFFHTLRNRLDTTDCHEHNFGALHDDGSPKPSYNVIKTALTT